MSTSQPASNPTQFLDQIGRVLDSENVGWATIGALAVAYHGLVRASLDADALITLKNSSLDLDKLTQLFQRHGWKAEVRIGEEDDPLGFVIRIFDAGENQVDLIGGIRKLEPGFFNRAIRDDIDGLKLRIASLEDLIALKIFAGGPKDLDDARGILEVQGSSIDKELLLRLCKGFGSIEEKCCKKLLDS